MKIVRGWEIQGFEPSPPYLRTLKVLMSPRTHGIKNLAIGMVIIPPNSRSDSHDHESSEEYWIVSDGHGKVVIGEEEENIEPGMIIYAPSKVKHHLINNSKEPLKIYFIFAPSGPEERLLEQISLACKYRL